jgi:hypothetical protein
LLKAPRAYRRLRFDAPNVGGLLDRTGLALPDRGVVGLALARFTICSLVIAEPRPRPAVSRDDLIVML